MDDDANHNPGRYSIGELADAGGVSRRTVRFYVQRGLIAPPHGGGRGAFYDASHLAQLLAVKLGQEKGLPLAAIAESEAPELSAEAAPAEEAWSRLQLAPGVELHLRQGALTPARRQLLVMALRTVLTPREGEIE